MIGRVTNSGAGNGVQAQCGVVLHRPHDAVAEKKNSLWLWGSVVVAPVVAVVAALLPTRHCLSFWVS